MTFSRFKMNYRSLRAIYMSYGISYQRFIKLLKAF